MYYYTELKQDGTYTVVDETPKKWEFDRIRKFVGGFIEYMPSDYMPKGMTGQVIGHEEARFNSNNVTNPFMEVLIDMFGEKWDCVGNLLLEQTEKQFNKWQASLTVEV